jgi:C4-dicarboxylate transporter DctM subunit
MTSEAKERKLPFFIFLAVIVFLPFLGKGGILAAVFLAAALAGSPLFVLMGLGTLGSLYLWSDFREPDQFSIVIEGIRSLADSPTLLAIPFFIMSGAIMNEGQISRRLVDFAQALIGWLPGGMAMSAVVACMLFAAISGSSPATVVAIGSMMGPALILAGYHERFSHGLLTSAGSLGILIPPSIPMIIYPIVNQTEVIEVERLFASGFGPGLVMGSILIGYSFYEGLAYKVPTQAFRFQKVVTATRDGFWALLFPVLILGGVRPLRQGLGARHTKRCSIRWTDVDRARPHHLVSFALGRFRERHHGRGNQREAGYRRGRWSRRGNAHDGRDDARGRRSGRRGAGRGRRRSRSD